MKKLLTIQDISCVGKCSLTVALPIISSLGVECAIIPTAVLSTHTMFNGFTFHDLTNEIKPIMDHWEKEGFSFSTIYTGYLGSKEQIELMKELFSRFGNGALKVVDPCMADNGKLYPGFTTAFAHEMATLSSDADVLVPNLTEASFLLDRPYISSGYDDEYVKETLLSLSKLGAKKIVLKGIEYGDGKIGIYSYDSEKKVFDSYFHEKMSTSFHGTGDIFASVLASLLTQGVELKDAYSIAGDFVVESIKRTLKEENHSWYGVNFEEAIPYLEKRYEEVKK